jgi:hypothetical protein
LANLSPVNVALLGGAVLRRKPERDGACEFVIAHITSLPWSRDSRLDDLAVEGTSVVRPDLWKGCFELRDELALQIEAFLTPVLDDGEDGS